MEIEYTTTDYSNKEKQEVQSVAQFLYEELFFEEHYNNTERVRLEDQPKKICEALGRLVEKLLDKGIFNLEDLRDISGCNWGRKADSLKLKKEEKEE